MSGKRDSSLSGRGARQGGGSALLPALRGVHLVDELRLGLLDLALVDDLREGGAVLGHLHRPAVHLGVRILRLDLVEAVSNVLQVLLGLREPCGGVREPLADLGEGGAELEGELARSVIVLPERGEPSGCSARRAPRGGASG